jgi:7-carboxy-7-deazaguanine synthase (Cx14CxxC type)
MTYSVKEIVYTLQGEGANTGRPAVFLRFAGCNLWTGHEVDRATAVCQFCDTDFVGTDGPGGGRFETARDLAAAVHGAWVAGNVFGRAAAGRPFVVGTGGEPLLQLDEPLVEALHAAGFEIAIETNGTLLPPRAIDWICVSPKANAPCVLRRGDELKLIYPQAGAEPEQYATWDFRYFFLQPMDGPQLAENTRRTVDYCLKHSQWRLSLQTHKLLGLP